jgi:O-acetyl-ADP-ribose deacetylase (regulator of RNase III)
MPHSQFLMDISIVEGDLLDQDVEVIVNSWNRNIIPWWLLIPQGVSGAIKRKAGLQPFQEVARAGPIHLGDAVLTSAGRLPFKGIIHVAGINLLWRASTLSIENSTRSAMQIVNDHRFRSVAFPLIGCGSGGFNEADAIRIMKSTISQIETNATVVLVVFGKAR